jgi:2,4-diaminopentanoate dehydrogenase
VTRALRVIQWATGNVGAHAVAAVHDHPDLELVGAFAYDDTKVGRDVGEICGIGEIGVTTTNDVDKITALDADCVLYMPAGEWNPAGALEDVCRLLASGKNVVSTAVTAWIYPQSAGGDVADRLEAACQAGKSSFHATGIQPGWAAEVLPLTMSGLFRRIDSLLVQEVMDYTTYAVPFVLFDVMGFGKYPDEAVPMADPAIGASPFKAPLMLVAAGLGATIEDYLWEREVCITSEPIDVKAGRIEAGTVAAQRFSLTAVIEGRRALTVEHITRLGADQAPHWPRGRGWKVTVEGLPSMVLEARIAVHDEDDTDQGCLGTAMHAVHAIAPVCAATPGVRTFLDLPTIIGRGVLSTPASPTRR